MSRNKARTIIRELRDTLADRIANLVIENEESLRQDYEGYNLSLNNEFYELVERLRSITLALDMLPADNAKPQVTVVDTLNSAEEGLVNMGTFLEAVDSFDLETAAGVLSIVFDLDLDRARECTSKFFVQCETLEIKFQMFQRIASMRSDTMNDLMMLMYDLFGLTGLEAVDCIQAYRNH